MQTDKDTFPPEPRNAYEARVWELEDQGCTTSDAQGIANAEGLDASLDAETIPPREKLAQFKLTDAQRLAFMTEERDELKAQCAKLRAVCKQWEELDRESTGDVFYWKREARALAAQLAIGRLAK